MDTGCERTDEAHADRASETPLEFTTLVAPAERRWLWFIPLLALTGAGLWYYWPRPAERPADAPAPSAHRPPAPR